MRTIRFWRLISLAISPFLVSAVQARAQAPRGPYYHRTTTPGVATARVGSHATRGVGVAAPSRVDGVMDRLRPYAAADAWALAGVGTAPLGNTYSSRPRAVSPPARPSPPAARNYFPTARVGQGPNRNIRDHCSPSRGGMIVGLR